MGDICTFLSRGKSPKYLDNDRTYPVFAQKCNLKEGGISLAQARFLDPSTIGKWDDIYKLRTGDVLINSTGTGTVGRTRLFDESCLGDYPFVVPDSHVSVVRTDNNIESAYVYAYFSSDLVQEYLGSNLAGSTNQKELYINVLESLAIPIPPYKEQTHIVSEINKWNKYINTIEQRKQDLQITIKQAKSKILDLAIHGKLVPQDPTDEPACELLKRINPKAEITCDNPQYGKQPFDIPQTWSWVKLGDIASSNIGLTYRPTDITLDGIPVYRSNNIKNGVIDTSDIVRVNTKILNKQFLNEGDLLICARNGSRNLVGKNAIIEKLIEPTSFGAFMAVCRSEYNHWIRILLNTEYFDRYLDNSNSATINQLTQNMLLSFHIPFPPLNEQNRIVAKIEELFAQLDNIASSL